MLKYSILLISTLIISILTAGILTQFTPRVSNCNYQPKDSSNYSCLPFNNKIEIFIQKYKIPSVAIGYISGGKLQQIRVIGELKKGYAAQPESLYRVSSLTKLITAIVTLKLVDDKKWSLDEPVYRYYVDPQVKGQPFLKKLTTRHILSHQSGLPNWRHLTKSGRLSFEHEPSTRFQYSGEGFEFLRKALEKKLKKSFDELAQELVFKPLNMLNTHFYWNNSVNENDYALEHDENGIPLVLKKYSQTNAAANLLTTIGDFSNFMAYIINGAGLSENMRGEFSSKQSTLGPETYWGLGCQVISGLENEEQAIGHTGGDYGTTSLAIILPKSKRGLVIFSNSENGNLLWKTILEEYLGKTGTQIAGKL